MYIKRYYRKTLLNFLTFINRNIFPVSDWIIRTNWTEFYLIFSQLIYRWTLKFSVDFFLSNQKTILFLQISSKLNYNLRYQLLTSYSRCSRFGIYLEPAISNVVLFCVCSVNWIHNDYVIQEILLSCLRFWLSFEVIVLAEPEISSLVLIFYRSLNCTQTMWQLWWRHLWNSCVMPATCIPILILLSSYRI